MNSAQNPGYQHIAPPGSDLYYSLRFIPAEQRNALVTLHALVQAIEQVLYDCREPHVAQQKMGWWLQELKAIYEGKAQHPLGQAAQAVVTHFAIPQRLFIQIIVAFSKRLQSADYQHFNELTEHHYRAISSFPLLVATLTGHTDNETLRYAHDLGISLQLIDLIHTLRRDLNRGFVYLAEQDLTRFQVSEQSLLRFEPSASLSQLLQTYAQTAREYYAKALEQLPSVHAFSQLASLTLARIKLRLLQEIEKADFPVLTQRIELTPVHKLWLAWREYTKQRKNIGQ